jgi:hypothetical protein
MLHHNPDAVSLLFIWTTVTHTWLINLPRPVHEIHMMTNDTHAVKPGTVSCWHVKQEVCTRICAMLGRPWWYGSLHPTVQIGSVSGHVAALQSSSRWSCQSAGQLRGQCHCWDRNRPPWPKFVVEYDDDESRLIKSPVCVCPTDNFWTAW